MWVQWLLVDKDVGMEVDDLLADAVVDLLHQRVVVRQCQAQVLHQLLGEQLRGYYAVVNIPGEGVADADFIVLNVEPDGHQLVNLLGLDEAVFLGDV